MWPAIASAASGSPCVVKARRGGVCSSGASQRRTSDQFRGRYTVHRARKGRTFFFNALTADGFDAVVNPVVLEPVVQFTLYLKLKYEIEGAKGK